MNLSILPFIQQFELFNPEEVNGVKLFEKDILLSPEQLVANKKGITNIKKLWLDDNGNILVPWLFADG